MQDAGNTVVKGGCCERGRVVFCRFTLGRNGSYAWRYGAEPGIENGEGLEVFCTKRDLTEPLGLKANQTKAPCPILILQDGLRPHQFIEEETSEDLAV